MLATTVKRIIQGIFVVFFVIFISFVLMRLIPGDPAKTMSPSATNEQLQQIRTQLGLGKPIILQFGIYMAGLLHGDFGQSYFKGMSVITAISNSIGKTAILIINTIVFSVIISLLLGIFAALKSGTWIDRLVSGISVVFQSVPNYWLAAMLIVILSVKLGLLPAMGYNGYSYTIIPTIALSLPLIAVMTKNVRSSMMGSLNQEYVKAAKARGIGKFTTIFKYAMRNSLIPLITVLGGQLGFLIGSVVVIEYICSFPGIGLDLLNAIFRRDYNLVQGIVIIFSSFFIIVNMIIDLLYVYLDPRLRKA